MLDETLLLLDQYCVCINTKNLSLATGNICPRCRRRKRLQPDEISLDTDESDFENESLENNIATLSYSEDSQDKNMDIERAILRLQEISFNLPPFSGLPGEDFDVFLAKFNSFWTK